MAQSERYLQHVKDYERARKDILEFSKELKREIPKFQTNNNFSDFNSIVSRFSSLFEYQYRPLLSNEVTEIVTDGFRTFDYWLLDNPDKRNAESIDKFVLSVLNKIVKIVARQLRIMELSERM